MPTSAACAAGTAAGLLTLVRTLGVVVIPATVLVLAWRRQRKAAILLVATAVLVMLPWQLWVGANADALPAVLQGKYGSYTGWLIEGVRDGGLPWVLQLIRFNLYQLAGQGWATVTVESLAGIRAAGGTYNYSPYNIPGDTNSGLLPLVNATTVGTVGAGDQRLQAYNYRLCLTQNPTNKIPIAPPAGYSEANYELARRYIDARVASNGTVALNQLIDVQMIIVDLKSRRNR